MVEAEVSEVSVLVMTVTLRRDGKGLMIMTFSYVQLILNMILV